MFSCCGGGSAKIEIDGPSDIDYGRLPTSPTLPRRRKELLDEHNARVAELNAQIEKLDRLLEPQKKGVGEGCQLHEEPAGG